MVSTSAFTDRALAEGFRAAVAAAARAVAPLVGRGDPIAVDAAAVAALRVALSSLPVDGRIIAGEGEKDDAPMLDPGERFGTGGIAVDVAIDPVDGTKHAAAGRAGAMAVLAVAPRGAFVDIGPAHYLEKFVTWLPDVAVPADGIDAALLDAVVERCAGERGVDRSEVVVFVQDRPRNAVYIEAARVAGARVECFADGDVERGLRVLARGADVLVGIGGAPEGVLTAAAARALKGTMFAAYAPQSAGESTRLASSGRDAHSVMGLDRLCAEPARLVFAAVTACSVGGVELPGVEGGATVATWGAEPDGAIEPRFSLEG